MDITYKTRYFNPTELRLLRTLQTQKRKKGVSKIKVSHFLGAALLGAGFTYLATLTKNSFWVLPLGTIAVFAYAFIVFAPYELYKLKKRHLVFLNKLNGLIDKGTVDTCVINAKRIAIAEEYEDEGDLFIIEYNSDNVLYLWDYDYNLRKKLPCLNFEIYEESFFKLLGRQVNPLSDRIDALIIDKKAKWNYMKRFGAPGHLQTDNINFDKLIEEYNNCTKYGRDKGR